MNILRRCGGCGGKVTHTHVAWRPGEPRLGLGHWHCAGNCKRRHITVIRFVGAGKESERDSRNASGYGDAVMRSISVLRDIAVITHRTSSKSNAI